MLLTLWISEVPKLTNALPYAVAVLQYGRYQGSSPGNLPLVGYARDLAASQHSKNHSVNRHVDDLSAKFMVLAL